MDPHDDWKGCVVLLYNVHVHMVCSPYFWKGYVLHDYSSTVSVLDDNFLKDLPNSIFIGIS